MKKAQRERCKKLLEQDGEKNTVYRGVGNFLSGVYHVFKLLNYNEKTVRPEDLAKITISLEQLKFVYDITDAEIEVEENYILDAAEFSGRKKK